MIQPELGCKLEEMPPSVFIPSPPPQPLPRTYQPEDQVEDHVFCQVLPGLFLFSFFYILPSFSLLPLLIHFTSITIFLSHPSLSLAHIFPQTPAILSHRDFLRNPDKILLVSCHLGGVHLYVAVTQCLTLECKSLNTHSVK